MNATNATNAANAGNATDLAGQPASALLAATALARTGLHTVPTGPPGAWS